MLVFGVAICAGTLLIGSFIAMYYGTYLLRLMQRHARQLREAQQLREAGIPEMTETTTTNPIEDPAEDAIDDS
jgi:hypothetical protein